jgi:hypothetical protein
VLGVKAAVTPAGNALVLSATSPAKPRIALTFTVKLVLCPAVTLCVAWVVVRF